jgi:ribosomal protein L14
LASDILATRIIPRRAATDAAHIFWRVVMPSDPIVDEVRRARESEAAKHGFDVKAILAASKKRQRRAKRKVVSFARKGAKLSA